MNIKDLQNLKDERKKELLKKVDSEYDDMTQETTYNYKGYEDYQKKCAYEIYNTEPYNTREKVIFNPLVTNKKDENTADFFMSFWLLRDNWIFFEKMIFNIDGNITEVSKDNIEKYTQVVEDGLVLEVAGLYLQKYPMINALVTDIINGNNVKVRLVGDGKGNVDFTLTDTDKENLKLLFELSLCF